MDALCHPQQRRGSAKQVVASAHLSHPDVWSLELMNVGHRKLHHLRLLKSDSQRRYLCTHVSGKHSGGGGLICKSTAAVLFTLEQGTLAQHSTANPNCR